MTLSRPCRPDMSIRKTLATTTQTKAMPAWRSAGASRQKPMASSATPKSNQAQILELIVELQREFGAAVILITHDLGVVAETARRVIVMYAGRKVEEAEVGELFARPLHPYTRGLMASIPRLDLLRGENRNTTERLQEIPGIVPPLFALPEGCAFAPRCPRAMERCRQELPELKELRPGRWAACFAAEQAVR